MSGPNADTVRRLADIERRLAQMERQTRPYTTVRARVYGSTQAIPNLIATVVTFDDSRWNTAGMWDASDPTRLTCMVGGLYAIGANVQWQPNATGDRRLNILLNGATVISDSLINAVVRVATPTHQNISTHYELAVGDYLEIVVQQTSGGSLNINSAAAYSPEFWVTRIA